MCNAMQCILLFALCGRLCVMIRGRYHIHILDLEGDRGRLATELRTTKAKYQQGDEADTKSMTLADLRREAFPR